MYKCILDWSNLLILGMYKYAEGLVKRFRIASLTVRLPLCCSRAAPGRLPGRPWIMTHIKKET